MKQKWVKRIARAMVPCFVFFVFSFSFAPKVYAASVSVPVQYGKVYTFSTSPSQSQVSWADTTLSTPISNAVSSGQSIGTSRSGVVDLVFQTKEGTTFSENATVYISYYFTGYVNGTTSNFFDVDTWETHYFNHDGINTMELGIDSITSYAYSGSATGYGYSLEHTFVASEAFPISKLTLKRQTTQAGFTFATGASTTASYVNPCVMSARIISTATSAETDALNKVADEIIAQTELLSSMKGDIVAILQDIYTVTGDIEIAQNLLNSYIEQMLPILRNIDSNTASILSLLRVQLLALETAIENATTSIEAAISAQTAAMIAYLESVLNTGNEVPDDTYQQQQDAANILDQMESLEKPDVNTVVPEIGDYSDSGVSGVLSAIFSSNLIVTMMTLSSSFAFGAYVLFGKRE